MQALWEPVLTGVGVEEASVLGTGVVLDRDVGARVVGTCAEGAGVEVVVVEGVSVQGT